MYSEALASSLGTFVGVKQLLTFCDNGTDDGKLSWVQLVGKENEDKT